MSAQITPDVIADLYDAVAKARESFAYQLNATEQWVVVGSSQPDRNYIFVGEEKPTYNDTQFGPLSPMTADFALRFDSQTEAEKYGFNHYLRDGENKPIYMKSMRLSEYAKMVIEDAEKQMNTLLNIRRGTHTNTK